MDHLGFLCFTFSAHTSAFPLAEEQRGNDFDERFKDKKSKERKGEMDTEDGTKKIIRLR